jgi:hypothetical protein
MAQLHGPRRNSAMEPVPEPAVAEMSRPVPARTALSFSRASLEGPRIKKDRVDPSGPIANPPPPFAREPFTQPGREE